MQQNGGNAVDYCLVQMIAKDTIEYIKTIIHPGISLAEVRMLCENKMLSLGADSFWYWNIGAFVFAGDETAISISGKAYKTSDRLIAPDDIITIDLSPQVGGIWGDYARTIIVENGSVVLKTSDIRTDAWRNALELEDLLHAELKETVRPTTTFEELYDSMNEYIQIKGYINLDFAGNLGHSIVRRKEDRIYIERGNHTKLGDVRFFTFEPHIGTAGSKYGFKQENIYYFDSGVLKEL